MSSSNESNVSPPRSLQGYFLISESNMSDPNFFQTVILILEHNAEGAFGLVVNRRSRLSLGTIIPDLAGNLAAQVSIYVGGPVQQEYLFALHGELPDQHEGSKYCISPVEGVVFEPSFRKVQKFFEDETVQTIPADDIPKIHLFLGYSGWAPGQLEHEMEQGSWITHPASARIVFYDNPEQGWKEALRAKGGIYKVFANSNQNPSLN